MDLSNDVIESVLGHLSQFDLLNYSYTCKSSNELANEVLYSKIYITGRGINVRIAIKDSEDKKAYHSWTVLRNSLGDSKCGVKLLERTFSTRRDLAAKVRDIITDDVTFVLFKLKFWYKKYFEHENNLSRVFFGDIPLNQMNVVYEDIFDFYNLPGLNLKSLQLKSVSDLIKLLSNYEFPRLKAISFNFVDMDDFSIDSCSINSEVKQKMRAILGGLEVLSILSAHNLGLNFFHVIRDLFPTGCIFSNLKELTLNHSHGQMCSSINFNSIYNNEKERALDFRLLKEACNFSIIEKLSLHVDCNYIYKVQSPEDFNFSVCENNDYCDCLERFFSDFASSIEDLRSLKELSITRNNRSLIENPFGIFYFKHCLHRLLCSGLKLNVLSIDTSVEPFPYFHFKEDERFAQLFNLFISQNKQLLDTFDRIDVKELHIKDYIESFYIWHVAVPQSNEGHLCKCERCEVTRQSMTRFVKTNEEIQFYLNPTAFKSINEYLFDLVSVLLKYRKNYKLANPPSNSHEPITVASKIERHDNPVIYIAPHDHLMQVHNRDTLNLHTFFRHDDYKDLVNFKYIKNLVSASNCEMKISCHCNTSDIHDFYTFLTHQLQSHIANECIFKSPHTSYILNNLLRI